MNLTMIKKNKPTPAYPKFSEGNTLDRLTVTNYVGREHNPTGAPGLQHLYDIECECGDESQWFQVDLNRVSVGPKECNACRMERNLKRKEARKKGPITTGNITPKNVLSRMWK
jgi:hypothetical protein